MRYTPPDVLSLAPNEIFVFGSNTEGRHGKGAAKFAMQKFGAKWGDAEGLTGRCYALPTVGNRLSKMTVSQIAKHAGRFKACAAENPDKIFLLTLVGCGLAGHKVRDIAPLFADCPPNVVKPIEFCQQASPA